MALENFSVLAAGLVCFAAFSWGVKGHFRSTGEMPRGMRLTSALSLAAFGWFCWRAWALPATGWGWAALVMMAQALAVFLWAIRATRRTPPTLAFATDRPTFLLHQGPYRYVRHPFYLAYLLFWTGTALATPEMIGWAAPLVMLIVYSQAAIREERKFAGSDLAAAYGHYRAKAGMFLPRLSVLMPG